MIGPTSGIGNRKVFWAPDRQGGPTPPSLPSAASSAPYRLEGGVIAAERYYPVRELHKIAMCSEAEFRAGLDSGEIAFAQDQNGNFAVCKEAFDYYAGEIYKFDAAMAKYNIENFCRKTNVPNPDLNLKRRLFNQIEKAVLESPSAGNKRHLGFMLKEASEIGCDYITAIAILLHNDFLLINQVLTADEKTDQNRIRIINQVLETIRVFSKLNGLYYSPPENRPTDDIETFMLAMLKISKGNWRALVLFWAHKLSALTIQAVDANDIAHHSVCEVYAPLAEALGKSVLASKLRNQAYRLYKAKEFSVSEQSIIAELNQSRSEAEIFLRKIRANLYGALTDGGYTVRAYSRIKGAWEASEKAGGTGYKREDVGKIENLKDLRGMIFLTDRPITKTDAEYYTELALETSFLKFDETQTRTYQYKNGNETEMHEVIHLGVIIKEESREISIEIQFMDQSNWHTFSWGEFAHWIYKLGKRKESADQKFSHRFWQNCSLEMNGDLAHDLMVLYNHVNALEKVFVFYEGQKKKSGERTLQAKALPTNAIPFDLAALVLNKEMLFQYSGTKVRKPQEDARQAKKTGEGAPLADGSIYFIILDSNKRYLFSLAERQKRLQPATLRARVYLNCYTDDLLGTAADKGRKLMLQQTGKRIFDRKSRGALEKIARQMGFTNMSELFAYAFFGRDKNIIS